jgi:hypothetical protein
MKQKLILLLIPALFICLVLLPACKSEDEIDIRGTWNHTSTLMSSWSGTMTFQGSDLYSGTATEIDPDGTMTGTWTRTGSTVTVNLVWEGVSPYNWNLTINSENSMTGTCSAGGYNGPATFTR